MLIKDMPEESRPRERFLKNGADALSNAELLAIIIQQGIKKESALDVANRVLKKHSLVQLAELSIPELYRMPGIGTVKALQIRAAFELCKRAGSIVAEKIQLKAPKDVYEYLRPAMQGLKQEHFFVLCLDTKKFLIAEKVIAIGTLNAVLIHPREVFKEAIKHSADTIILAHNHTSGDPEPSAEDMKVTDDLMSAAGLIGIEVLDHVIIGKDTHWSWKESR